MTFSDIIRSVQSHNMAQIKDRAFAANRLAKVTDGRSRSLCYQMKNAAICALLKHESAFLGTVDATTSPEPLLGIWFVGGGRLHAKPSSLNAEAKCIIRSQIAVIASNFAAEPELGDRI